MSMRAIGKTAREACNHPPTDDAKTDLGERVTELPRTREQFIRTRRGFL